jgi:hypothetical protein
MVNARMLPMLEAFEGGGGEINGGAAKGGSNRSQFSPKIETSGSGIPPGPMPMDGESEDDERDRSDLEDGGQITQDERGNPRWIGSSNTFSLLDSFSSRPPDAAHQPWPGDTSPHPPPRPEPTSRNSNPYFGPVAGSGVVKALPGVEEVSYPSRRAAEEMVDAFFAEVHPCLPILIEHEFRPSFTQLMERQARSEPVGGGTVGLSLLRPEVPLTGLLQFIAVVFAVFALGERVIVTSRAWQRELEKLHQAGGAGGSEKTVLPGEAEAGVIWCERCVRAMVAFLGRFG